MQSNLDVRVVLSMIEEREARLRRTSLPIDDHDLVSHRPLRRWVGRMLVRFGTRLAAEQTMRPARAR